MCFGHTVWELILRRASVLCTLHLSDLSWRGKRNSGTCSHFLRDLQSSLQTNLPIYPPTLDTHIQSWASRRRQGEMACCLYGQRAKWISESIFSFLQSPRDSRAANGLVASAQQGHNAPCYVSQSTSEMPKANALWVGFTWLSELFWTYATLCFHTEETTRGETVCNNRLVLRRTEKSMLEGTATSPHISWLAVALSMRKQHCLDARAL
jgi:hypothetical protein